MLLTGLTRFLCVCGLVATNRSCCPHNSSNSMQQHPTAAQAADSMVPQAAESKLSVADALVSMQQAVRSGELQQVRERESTTRFVLWLPVKECCVGWWMLCVRHRGNCIVVCPILQLSLHFLCSLPAENHTMLTRAAAAASTPNHQPPITHTHTGICNRRHSRHPPERAA